MTTTDQELKSMRESLRSWLIDGLETDMLHEFEEAVRADQRETDATAAYDWATDRAGQGLASAADLELVAAAIRTQGES